jgi:hypothetical protein
MPAKAGPACCGLAAEINLLAPSFRGKKVAAANLDLQFSNKRIARSKNAWVGDRECGTTRLDVDDLIVSQAHVGKAGA